MPTTARNLLDRHSSLVALAVALLIAVAYAAALKPWSPVFDELEYLAYGRSLALAGVYAATPEGPAADAGPGREPAYPAMIALAARLDPGLAEMFAACWPYRPACGGAVGDLRYLNALAIALSAWLVYLTVRALGQEGTAPLVAGGYILFNVQMNKTATHVISDYLALCLVAAAGCFLVKAVNTRRVGWWIAAGLALAALTLTKGLYLPFVALVVIGLIAWGLRRDERGRGAALRAAAIVAAIAVVAVGGWAARNRAEFGVAQDPRGAIVLSTREALDHMSPAENAAAFLWWTRGFGERAARRLLPEAAWHRHELYADDGFYLEGQVHRYEARVARVMAETGSARPQAEAAVPALIAAEIAARWPSYLASMPAVFYRGLWFDEFVVFGFPAFVWLLWRCARRRDGPTFLALAGGLFSLLAYPALSLNIPRYQFTAGPAFAIAAGLAVAAILRRLHPRRPTAS